MDIEIVKLDVGGRMFKTTRATLAPPTEPNSLFATMFRSERPPAKMDADGNVFIDRNPDRFAIILDFLQTGILPRELQCSLELLRVDAEYFGIEGLLKIIGQRKTEEQRRKTEEQRRKGMAQARLLLEVMAELYWVQISEGGYILHEHPLRATSWREGIQILVSPASYSNRWH